MQPIGEAARQSGVSIETIRYYEREGIVPAPGRAASGRRLYSRDEIGTLRFIKRCRDLGFSISDIRTLMKLAAGRERSCVDVGRLGNAQLAETQRKISELVRLEAALAELTRNCDAGKTKCGMLVALLSE
jgi:DNA-binding transcriptional MerR regulator